MLAYFVPSGQKSHSGHLPVIEDIRKQNEQT
jgi:hypothetical protein